MRYSILVLGALMLGACSSKKVPVGIENGDVIESSDAVVAAAKARAEAAKAQAEADRDAAAISALSTCQGHVCEALAQGELTLGMNKAQVLAVTGTSDAAWRVRSDGNYMVMTPTTSDMLPRDRVADVAIVHITAQGVSSYTYMEPLGARVVSSLDDRGYAARSADRGQKLIEEGDAFAIAGQMDRALLRYDQASVLVDDPMLQYKAARVLDSQMRPLEAMMRYRLFLHQLELEKIEAYGDAYAKQAAAIAHAKERIMVIERSR